MGGVVAGNPFLAGGDARVIVNQVNSVDPSCLGGQVEIAGSRAELVIANPSGLDVNGASFINASRTTLVTGQAKLPTGESTMALVPDIYLASGRDAGLSGNGVAQIAARENLEIQAGNDLVVSATRVQNQGQGATRLVAGNDLAPGTVEAAMRSMCVGMETTAGMNTSSSRRAAKSRRKAILILKRAQSPRKALILSVSEDGSAWMRRR